MKHIKQLIIDIDKKNNETVQSVQYDTNTRFIHINLISNSMALDITGCSVKISGTKPDGTAIFNNCTVVNAKQGFIEVELTEQINAVEGLVKCELKLYNGTGVLTTKQFNIYVTASVTSKTISSTNELRALTDALNKVQNIDNRFDELQEHCTGGNAMQEHSHANKTVLDKLSETDDELYYNNKKIEFEIKDGSVTLNKLGDDVKNAFEKKSRIIKGYKCNLRVNPYNSQVIMTMSIPVNIEYTQGTNINVKGKILNKAQDLRYFRFQTNLISSVIKYTNVNKIIPTNEDYEFNYTVSHNSDLSINNVNITFQFENGHEDINDLYIYDIEISINGVKYVSNYGNIKTDYYTAVYVIEDESSIKFDDIDKRKFDNVELVDDTLTFSSSFNGGIVKSIKLPFDKDQVLKGHKCNLRNNPYGKVTSVTIPISINKEYISNTSINIKGKLLHKEENLTLRRFCSSMGSNVTKYTSPASLEVSSNKIYEFNYNVSHTSNLSINELGITVDFGDVADISNLYVLDIEVSYDGKVYSQPNKDYNTTYYDAIYVIEGGENASAIDSKLEQFTVEFERKNNLLYEKSMYVITDSIGGSNDSLTHFHGLITQKNKMIRKADVVWGSTISNGVGAVSPFVNRIDNIDNAIKYDYVVLEGFTNDYTRNVPLGETISTDVTTYKGALNVLASKLISKFPNARIVFITPHLHNLNANENGDTMFDFAQATIDVLSRYAIPVLDMTRSGNVATCYDAHKELYGKSGSNYDIVHCNNEAHKVYATKLEAKLKSL